MEPPSRYIVIECGLVSVVIKTEFDTLDVMKFSIFVIPNANVMQVQN